MNRLKFPTLCAVAVLAVLALCTTALAAGTKVTVRIEGKHRTLLAATQVSPPGGSITKGHAPSGACPGASAAGALDVATNHRWNATFSTRYQSLFLTKIFGESYGSTASSYWGVWVDNVYASSGICSIAPRRGEHLLFAAVPVTGNAPYPTGLHGPRQASKGHSFTVKVVYYDAKGHARPLSGAHVGGGGLSAITGTRGRATLTARHTGKLELQASRNGYIRSGSVTVTVKK